MGKWIHRLSNIDIINKKAVCAKCGPVDILEIVGKYKCKISRVYQARNNKWTRQFKKWKPSYKYRKYFRKEDKCHKCGFKNGDFRFFDVNHKDGDHDNNRIDNLELLCPNCHRLETLIAWSEKRMSKYNRNFKVLTNKY